MEAQIAPAHLSTLKWVHPLEEPSRFATVKPYFQEQAIEPLLRLLEKLHLYLITTSEMQPGLRKLNSVKMVQVKYFLLKTSLKLSKKDFISLIRLREHSLVYLASGKRVHSKKRRVHFSKRNK